MPGRRLIFANGEYYHIFNRGVARQPIFLTQRDYSQALLTLSYYLFRNPPMKLSRYKALSRKDRDRVFANQQKLQIVYVKLLAFVFMPNHIHFLLQQVSDNGISRLMSQFQNSYTRYLNTKQDRVGAVFQGAFKAVHVETEEQLLHLSRYIHLNPVVSHVIRAEEACSYPWSSFQDYLRGQSSFVSLEPVLPIIGSPEKYTAFVMDNVDYAERLHQLKHLLLENP